MLIRWLPMSMEEKRLLSALVQGAQLKAHRYLDGKKVHRLHWSDTEKTETVADSVVERLLQREFVSSNMKFPAATYMLTETGRKKGSSLVTWALSPVTTHL